MKLTKKTIRTWIIVSGAMAICGWYLWDAQLRALRKTNCILLRSMWRIWSEAGKPQGEKLDQLMEGRRQQFLVETNMFQIQGATYKAQFELLDRTIGKSGRLLISTNGCLLRIREDGSMELLEEFEPLEQQK